MQRTQTILVKLKSIVSKFMKEIWKDIEGWMDYTRLVIYVMYFSIRAKKKKETSKPRLGSNK